MFIPTYEVSESKRRVEYWNSLLTEHKEKSERLEKLEKNNLKEKKAI